MVLLLDPVVSGWQTANLTLPLVLGLAMVWRYRDRPLVSGLVVALIISLKVFVWPIGLWLIATRRYVATAYALAFGVLINAVAWAVIGFGQIRPFIRMSSFVTNMWHRTGYSLIAFGIHLGASRGVATAFMIAVSVAVALACVVAGRRGARAERPAPGGGVDAGGVAADLEPLLRGADRAARNREGRGSAHCGPFSSCSGSARRSLRPNGSDSSRSRSSPSRPRCCCVSPRASSCVGAIQSFLRAWVSGARCRRTLRGAKH